MKVLTNNNSRLTVLFTLIFVLLFYFNNETLPNNLSQRVSQPCMFVAIGELAFFIISGGLKYLTRGRSLVVASVLIFLTIFSGLFDSIFSNGYSLLIMNILVAVTFVSILPYNVFVKYFVHVTVFFAIASLLITYLLSPVVRILPLSHLTNSAGVSFTNAYLCYLVDYDGYIRNTGIFREAGVWGGFLSLALILLISSRDLFSKKIFNIFSIILVLTILSTFSTTCFLTLLLIYIVSLLQSNNGLRNNKFLFFVLLLGVAAFFYYRGSIEEIDNTFNKLSRESSSYQTRTEIIVNSISIMFNNPFGLGIVNGAAALMQSNTLDAFHNTSTLVAGGVYFGFLYLIIYIIGMFLFCKKRLGTWMFIIPLFLLLSGEQYIFNPWWYMFLFYGFTPADKRISL